MVAFQEKPVLLSLMVMFFTVMMTWLFSNYCSELQIINQTLDKINIQMK